jgi:hypothetical protein
MGAVFRYMEDITREIKLQMESERASIETFFVAFEEKNK